jgi:hypothetical protein
MKESILQFLHWISLSFGGSGEVSGRRLTAFAITNVYILGRIRFIMTVTDVYYLLLGCAMDAAFILLLFGIVTMQQITEFKNGNNNPPKPNADKP